MLGADSPACSPRPQPRWRGSTPGPVLTPSEFQVPRSPGSVGERRHGRGDVHRMSSSTGTLLLVRGRFRGYLHRECSAHTAPRHQEPPRFPSKGFTAISPVPFSFRESSTQASGDGTLQLVPSKLTSHGSGKKKKRKLRKISRTPFVRRCNATEGEQHPPTAWVLWKAAPAIGCAPLAPCLTLRTSCPIPLFLFDALLPF